MRKLASIQEIAELVSIPEADRIELAKIKGWRAVVKKGQFKVGDKCVFIEIDSVLPDIPLFDFLRDSKGKIKPIKTQRIRGVISQGLVMPIDIISGGNKLDIDTNVTDELGIKKKEDKTIVKWYKQFNKVPTLPFPAFIHKTDEERVQNLQNCLDRHIGVDFVVTEKLDGTSFTVYIKDGHFGICSRNMEIPLDTVCPYQYVAFKYMLKEKFEKLRAENTIPYDFAIQGEIIGKGIQGNKYELQDLDCRLFNFINLNTGEEMGFYFSNTDEFKRFNGIALGQIAYYLDMETVPILIDDFEMINDIDKIVEMSYGKSVLNPEHNREGIVFRAKYNSDIDKSITRLSFKAINPAFLLKE